MARIGGIDLPKDKRIETALTYIYGLGPTFAKRITAEAGVQPEIRVKNLTEDEVYRLQSIINQSYKIEGELKREVSQNIRRLIDIGSYRGLRHRRRLPVRGQRTRTNARTRKGPRKTVGGKKTPDKK
ncbi:30S ribosomal protein S13 [bacterium]|nr:30S ribosomal protein S13 [bacterium]